MESENISKTILDNGLTILTSNMPTTQSVSICLFAKVGSRYENTENSGISHFVEHMLFKGTHKRPKPYQIASEIENSGGLIDASTESEYTSIIIRIKRSEIKNSIGVLFDMILNPLFDPDAIQTERMVIMEELSMITDSPSSLADMHLTNLLWENHPLGMEIAGTKKTVASLDRSILSKHLFSFYIPNGIILSFAGNINHEEITNHIDHLSKNWSKSKPQTFPEFNHIPQSPKIKIEYRNTEQSNLTLGFCHPLFRTSDKFYQEIINTILGGSMSSKLFINIRELSGFAYDIHSDLISFTDTGALVISAGINPKNLYSAIDQILSQIATFSYTIEEKDIWNAKQLLTGRLLLDSENTNSVAYKIGQDYLFFDKSDTLQETISKINNVQLTDLLQFCDDVFKNSNISMAVVGPNRGSIKMSRIIQNFSREHSNFVM